MIWVCLERQDSADPVQLAKIPRNARLGLKKICVYLIDYHIILL